ncbi:MAG TPA: GNAT family N-acetyltransferase [Pyrinomonadaceae bacterium]|nr:GNAT family N-acetyltransferase [Pyrinomonadaceae bacterium]
MSAYEEAVEIRLATESDAMLLAKLRYEFRASFHDVIEQDASFVDRCSAWMQERLRADTHWKCWIAECGQTAVGNVWAQLVEKIPNPIAEPEQYVYVTNFYLRAEHRGQGIGSKLFCAVLDWRRSQSVHTVILWPTERSKSFYSRHGFSMADNIMQLKIDP